MALDRRRCGAAGGSRPAVRRLAPPASHAQDAEKPPPCRSRRRKWSPRRLSEQVTAVGTLLSDEAVTVSSEIPGRLKEIHFEEGQPVEKGAPLFTLDDSVYRAQLADAEAKLKLAEQTHKRTSTAVQQQIRDRAIGRRGGLQSRRQHGRGRARPRAAGEDAHRGAVLRHRRIAPCQRRRIHHRRPGARQSRGHRSGEGRFPRAREIPSGHQGRPNHPHQGRRLSRRDLRGQGLRHRSRASTSPAAACWSAPWFPITISVCVPGLFARVTVLLAAQGGCAERARSRRSSRKATASSCSRSSTARCKLTKVVTGTRREGTGRDRRRACRRRPGGDRGPAQDPRRQRRCPSSTRPGPEPVTLPELSIKRPVFATVMSLVLVLVGLVCLRPA